jgi:hypothetical protein
MFRKGNHVERLTKKVGQTAATGKVVATLDRRCAEVQWDDGHTSIISMDALAPLTEANTPHKDA